MKSLKPSTASLNDNDLSPNCEVFSTFFSTIGSDLNSKLDSSPNFSLNDKVPTTMLLLGTNEKEIECIIDKLSNKISEDQSGISNKFLKAVKCTIAPLLTDLTNRSIADGIYPNCLKTAKVVPIHNSGDKSVCSNYRPISLLPTEGKIFEKILKSRIVDFLDQNSVFTDQQFGFRNKRSTVDAIAIVIDSLRSDKITSTKSCCAFLDLKKLLIPLDHNLLLKKCELYGLRGHVMELTTSYLTDRKQFVLHNSLKSRALAINCGVPQGSVLGPMLFLLYINDMPKVCHTLKVTLFAGDTYLHCSYDNKNIDCVQQDLTKIEKWLGENKLTINQQKNVIVDPKLSIAN